MNALRLMIADNSTKEVEEEVLETTVQNVTIENDFSNMTSLNGTTSGTDDNRLLYSTNLGNHRSKVNEKNPIEEILSSTEMLILIFVILGLVFAAAIATRIWYDKNKTPYGV